MKIRPVEVEVLHWDGRTDSSKVTVTFQNFARAQLRNRQTHTDRCCCHVNLLNILWNCGNKTWAYGLCRSAHVHTVQVYVLWTISCTAVHTNNTHFTQQDVFVGKTVSGTQICVRWGVFVFQQKCCAGAGAGGDIYFEERGSSGGWTELHGEELRDLYWALNVGGRWDGWDKRNWIYTQNFSLKPWKEEALWGR